ncbi:hypothetical protein D3C72_2039170 [compost metagenome]
MADVFATLLVSVAVARTLSRSRPSSCATTCMTLVLMPCPISVPPWLTSTEPSTYTCTSAPAWFRCVTLKAMPNFRGVNASPFFRIGLASLNASIARRRVR